MIIGPPRSPGFAAWQQPAAQSLPTYGYQVVRVYPHDPNAFTQGLQYVDGFLYEGTGLNGRSSIRKVKLETGEVVQKRDVPATYFGEGITIWKSDLIELTWQSGIAFVYDKTTFQQRRTFTYVGEGWGLTHDAASLIMSDGSDRLRYLDPGHVRRTAAHAGDRRRRRRPQPERARVREGRDLRQHLADRPHRAHRAGRPRHGMDRSCRIAAAGGAAVGTAC